MVVIVASFLRTTESVIIPVDTCPVMLQAVDTNYTNAATKADPNQMVMFEGDEIKLDIAAEGVVLKNGWTITPYTHPGVSLTTTEKQS